MSFEPWARAQKLVKWEWLLDEPQISSRIAVLRSGALLGVPRLESFERTAQRVGKFTLTRVVWQYVRGTPLLHFRNRGLPWYSMFRTTQLNWRQNDFVHGDLSPRNILIDFPTKGTIPNIWCIDPLLCFGTSKGTPRYRSGYLGGWTPDLDEYCLTQILEEQKFPDRFVNKSPNLTMEPYENPNDQKIYDSIQSSDASTGRRVPRRWSRFFLFPG